MLFFMGDEPYRVDFFFAKKDLAIFYEQRCSIALHSKADSYIFAVAGL
jgi:hypothetical protein